MANVRNILVACDFSEHSAAALDCALDLARVLGAKVRVLNVYHRPVEALSPYEIPLPETVVRDIRQGAERRLEEILRSASTEGVPTEVMVLEGSAAEAISDAARALPADLIVMGTRGLTGLKHVLLGSVAERTVRIAPCPVLTVKAEKETRQGSGEAATARSSLL